jgi:hypothetical protein
MQRVLVVMAVVATCVGAWVPGAAPAAADDGTLVPPFAAGETWYVCQGYNGQISHTDNNDFYALDITPDPNAPNLALGGCNTSTKDTAAGHDVVAMGTGQLIHNGGDVVCLSFDAGGSAVIAHLEQIVPSGHVNQGDKIGVVEPAGPDNGGYSHLHISLWPGPFCASPGSSTVPFDSAHGGRFVCLPDLGYPAGAVNQWAGTAIHRATGVAGDFCDIAGNPHEDNIRKVSIAGIASGFPDGTYRPSWGVTRGQMATFLDRALDLPDVSGTPFTDIAGSPHAQAIADVAAAGIAGGFTDGTYRPNQAVTRGQMATFLDRALALPDAPAAPFTDVAGSPHAQAIANVALAGIAGGFPGATYRPGDAVTRGQMATFLARALAL